METGMIEIRAERMPFGRGVDLYVGEFDMYGQMIKIAEPVVMRRHDECSNAEPTISLRNNSAQMLMDELWRCGLRPSEGSGSAGSLAATERHLKDMQAIAIGLLRKDGVQVGKDAAPPA